MSGTGGRSKSSRSRPGRTDQEVAVVIVAVWPHPIVVQGRSTLHQDEVAGVARKVPLPQGNVGGAVDEHVQGGVEVVFQTISVGAVG